MTDEDDPNLTPIESLGYHGPKARDHMDIHDHFLDALKVYHDRQNPNWQDVQFQTNLNQAAAAQQQAVAQLQPWSSTRDQANREKALGLAVEFLKPGDAYEPKEATDCAQAFLAFLNGDIG